MKRKTLSRIALALCLLMIAPLLFACGQSGDNTPTTDGATNGVTEAPTTEAPTTTAEPTTPEPTDPPTTWEPIDPSLPYYEQMDIEFSRFGFAFDDTSSPFMSATEEDTMGKFKTNNLKKEELDVSGDGVPFTKAFRVEASKAPSPENEFWQMNFNAKFNKDTTLTQGDIIAGVIWVRDGGGENPGQLYIAMKTPTDNWATEGAMSINLVETTDKWQKVYFYGEVQADETKGEVLEFELFMGYGVQKVDIGGVYIKRFPATQFKAAMQMPYGIADM